MSLTDLSFIGVYFPLLLLAYYNPVFRSNGFRKFILLFVSLGLYFICCPLRFDLMLCVLIAANFVLVRLSDRFGKRIFRKAAIGLDVSVLLFFKYIARLLGVFLGNGELTSLAAPIGLSYYVFKLISYAVDSETMEGSGSIIDLTIYAANFLTVVSGPLSTYEDELTYIQNKRPTSVETAGRGFERIIIGLGKKTLIADSLGLLVKSCFAVPGQSVLMSWAGAVAYTLQIYFDFSGYTDIVLGAGSLFGFELPENFNYPYMARSVSEFWKRWHISLTKWLTKYVYIPLGGSRVNTKARHLFNLFAVWLVSGVWHGSRLTFLVWAAIYFVLQAIEKYTGLERVLDRCRLGHLYTMLVVITEWVIFRSQTLTDARAYLQGMFAFGRNVICAPGDLTMIGRYGVTFVLGILFATPIGEKIREASDRSAAVRCVYYLGLAAVLCICIAVSVSQGYSAPLYADF